MSLSLPKENWEITPVQAWFMLVERVGVRRLLGALPLPTQNVFSEGMEGGGNGYGGNGDGGVDGGETVIEALKGGLADLVACLGFGTVMDENGFWEVVRGVLGEV